MTESYIKAEIVRPAWTGEQWASRVFGIILMLGIRTLIVWWFFAAWFPTLGLTYWQLVLPVFVLRALIGQEVPGRILKK